MTNLSNNEENEIQNRNQIQDNSVINCWRNYL